MIKKYYMGRVRKMRAGNHLIELYDNILFMLVSNFFGFRHTILFDISAIEIKVKYLMFN